MARKYTMALGEEYCESMGFMEALQAERGTSWHPNSEDREKFHTYDPSSADLWREYDMPGVAHERIRFTFSGQ